MPQHSTVSIYGYRQPLTTAQLAESLGVCRSTALQLLQSKRVRSIRIGRRYLIPVEALEEFLKGRS